jgi:acyl-CoA synthetase (AMP-forming)/AMP-acid ligase II
MYLVDRANDLLIMGGENVYSGEVKHGFYQHRQLQSFGINSVWLGPGGSQAQEEATDEL